MSDKILFELPTKIVKSVDLAMLSGGIMSIQSLPSIVLISEKMHPRDAIKLRKKYSPEEIENLSRREEECLFYLLQAKSIKSIANILNISPRTVEAHISNIKNKWKAFNKERIFEKANLYGYINVPTLDSFRQGCSK
ncbi:MAG: LuxR C-terminal-related transcriptional regulator [Gammaproteobacteria bacterium]